MSLTTNTTIAQLPDSLNAQYERLCKESKDHKGVEKEVTVEYEINEYATKVIVSMQRTQYAPPKGVAFCGGKLSKESASVRVVPENEAVESAVSEFFKNKQFPALFMAPAMPVFDTVMINDEKIM